MLSGGKVKLSGELKFQRVKFLKVGFQKIQSILKNPHSWQIVHTEAWKEASCHFQKRPADGAQPKHRLTSAVEFTVMNPNPSPNLFHDTFMSVIFICNAGKTASQARNRFNNKQLSKEQPLSTKKHSTKTAHYQLIKCFS